MTRTTALLPGVDQHRDGYRVRVLFGSARHIETHPTADAANRRALELRELRDAGMTPASAPTTLTLQAAADALLDRKRLAVSRKTKQRLTPRGLEWWERALRPWREGEFAALPVKLLSRERIEDAYLRRAATYPKTAKDELGGLKAALRYAQDRGAAFDARLLTIEPVAVERRDAIALTALELEALAAHAPTYGRRMLLFAGTVGLRFGELAGLTDDRVDLDDGSLFIPASGNKEHRDKIVDLTPEEVELLREQLSPLRLTGSSSTAALPPRAPGTRIVFTAAKGGAFAHHQFLRRVWYPARTGLATDWRDGQGLPPEASTPYDDLVPHDLRATAATLMRDAGMSREDAAARLGHKDAGALLEQVYDRGDRRARARKALAALVPIGLRAQAVEPAQLATRTTAAGTGSTPSEGS